MGVPGLWDVVHVAGRSISLGNLAVIEGFQENTSKKRGYRIGIDASIWLHHASFSKCGENPQLRLLFFRVLKLLYWPILPLFMFDGRLRPKVKRGSKLGKSGTHPLARDFKVILTLMGIEWREAAGEAEAELAQLNRDNYVDAIMTDDVDAFLFGARTVIKNPGINLSGNKSKPALDKKGKPSKHHVFVYTADAIESHPNVALTRGGLILFALLGGGDYHAGVDKIGKTIAYGLARSGFGEQLLQAFLDRNNRDIHAFLPTWRTAVNEELRSNSRGFLPNRCASLKLPNGFPDLQILNNYANPVTSVTEGRGGGGNLRDPKTFNIAGLAAFCEEKFGEWGFKEIIIKRFRTLVWQPAFMHLLRRGAVEADVKAVARRLDAAASSHSVGISVLAVRKYLGGTPSADPIAEAFVNRGLQQDQMLPNDSDPLIMQITNSRQHPSTDDMLEFYVQISPVQFVNFATSGIKGFRGPAPTNFDGQDELDELGRVVETTTAKQHLDPQSPLSIWVPACMITLVHPEMVERFFDGPQAGRARTTKATTSSQPIRGSRDEEDDEDTCVSFGFSRSSPIHPARRPEFPPPAPRPSQFEFEGMTLVDVMPSASSSTVIDQPTPATPNDPGFGRQSTGNVEPSQSSIQSTGAAKRGPTAGLQRNVSILDLTISPVQTPRRSRRGRGSGLQRNASILDLTGSSPIRIPPEHEDTSTSSSTRIARCEDSGMGLMAVRPRPRNLGRARHRRYSEPLPDLNLSDEEMPRSRFDDIFDQVMAVGKGKGKERAAARQCRQDGSAAGLSRVASANATTTSRISGRMNPMVRNDIHERDRTAPLQPGASTSLQKVSALQPLPSLPPPALAEDRANANAPRQAAPPEYGKPIQPRAGPSAGFPSGGFDALFDQVMAVGGKKTMGTHRANPQKRPVPSLDMPRSQSVKRRKVDTVYNAPYPHSRAVSRPARPLPLMKHVPSVFLAEGHQMYDDVELEEPSLPSGQPMKRLAPSLSINAPTLRTPSSSQDSGLYDDDFIDLTGY